MASEPDVYTAGQGRNPAIDAAVKRLHNDGYSYRRIAAYLDRKGYKPSKAKTWSAMTVRNIYERSR